MSGREVWGIVAPILAAVMVNTNRIAIDAYIITYQALKEYDEHRKEGKE